MGRGAACGSSAIRPCRRLPWPRSVLALKLLPGTGEASDCFLPGSPWLSLIPSPPRTRPWAPHLWLLIPVRASQLPVQCPRAPETRGHRLGFRPPGSLPSQVWRLQAEIQAGTYPLRRCVSLHLCLRFHAAPPPCVSPLLSPRATLRRPRHPDPG